jgi:hypothetical protein
MVTSPFIHLMNTAEEEENAGTPKELLENPRELPGRPHVAFLGMTNDFPGNFLGVTSAP